MIAAQTMLVDDHPLFRLGLRMLLGRQAEVEFVVEAATPHEALDLAAQVRFDVALIDIVMPDGDGVALANALHRLQPLCKILGLSMIDEPVRIADMLRAGAAGYVLKTQPIEEIGDAIRSVLGGERYLPPTVIHADVAAALHDHENPFDRLTKREHEVFARLVRGESNSAISTGLFIAVRTVETHRQRIMKKLGAHSIVELLRLATRHGLA